MIAQLGEELADRTSFLLRVYAWIGILKNNGLINNFLMWIGVIDEPLVMLQTDFAIYVGIVYGKAMSGPGRKMGHVTALGATLDEAEAAATRCVAQIHFGSPT